MAHKTRYNLLGQKFGRLTVESFTEIRKGFAMWLCKCDCGSIVEVRTSSLTSLNTRSCGCLQREYSARPKPCKPITACPHVDRKHYGKGLCSACWKKQNPKSQTHSKRWREAYKEKFGMAAYSAYIRARNLWNNYRLSPESFQIKWEDQSGLCPCGRSFAEWKPQIDHNHGCCPGVKSCGKCVRGLLCYRCNTVLGLLEEDPRLLSAYLLAYLEKWA
jgi:recombination endonuclease VII